MADGAQNVTYICLTNFRPNLQEYHIIIRFFFVFSILSLLLTLVVVVILFLNHGDTLVILNGIYSMLLVISINLPCSLALFPTFFLIMWKNFLVLAFHLSLLLIYAKNYPKIALNKNHKATSLAYKIMVARGALLSVIVPSCILFIFLAALSFDMPPRMELVTSFLNIPRINEWLHFLFAGLVWFMALITTFFMFALLVSLVEKRIETKKKLSQSVITRVDVVRCFVNIVIYVAYSITQTYPSEYQRTYYLEFSNCLTGFVYFFNFGLSKFVRNVYSKWARAILKTVVKMKHRLEEEHSTELSADNIEPEDTP